MGSQRKHLDTVAHQLLRFSDGREDDRDKSALFRGSIYWPEGIGGTQNFEFFRPIHFPDGIHEPRHALRCAHFALVSSFPVLVLLKSDVLPFFQLLKGLAFGIKSIQPAALNNPKWKPTGRSNGNTWKWSCVTPGMLILV